LISTVIGVVWGVIYKYSWYVYDYARCNLQSEGMFNCWERYLFCPISLLAWFDLAVFWNSTLNWTGGNNLSYTTNGLYLSFIFIYYIKRHYSGWWEKYNYLLEAVFDIGLAVSGIIQTFAFAFIGITLSWWGDKVSQQGVDFQSYNQNSILLPLPPDGYFGLAPAEYQMQF
jgi:hypothetical protein